MFQHLLGPLFCAIVTVCSPAEHVKEFLLVVNKQELSEYLAKLGSKGGLATAKNRTPEQRKAVARKAAQARWSKAAAARKKKALQ